MCSFCHKGATKVIWKQLLYLRTVFKTLKESTTVKVIGIRVSTEIQREIILHLKKKKYPSEFKSWLHTFFVCFHSEIGQLEAIVSQVSADTELRNSI